MKLLLATNNRHKVSEFKSCFAQKGIDVEIVTIREVGFDGEIIENADTFEGNAYIKAKALCDYTGLVTIADDSGLSVDILNGAPGVYSARYAGEGATDSENIDKLLSELKDNLPAKAKFVCSICVCKPNGETLYVSGEANGEIIGERRGSGNFGYDPVFYYPPFKKTFAEISEEEKNTVSHRGKAIEKLLENKGFFE